MWYLQTKLYFPKVRINTLAMGGKGRQRMPSLWSSEHLTKYVKDPGKMCEMKKGNSLLPSTLAT